MVRPGQGSDMYRHNGAGEMLVFSAADFEDFREPRPDLAPSMEAELEPVIRLLAENRWPFRLHATYDETISRSLDVFERVHRDVPLTGLNWFFDHAETITPRNIDRIAALGGGIAIQHRMAFQGEYFAERYGAEATAATPPIQAMLAAGLPVGGGTDATRVASYNPWVSLWWLVSGRTVGGLEMYPPANRLDRETALRLWTEGSAWFSSEAGRKGRIAQGQLADLVVLSEDYMTVDEPRIRHIESVLTVVGGKVVHGTGGYQGMAPPLPPAAPDWSPVGYYGGYQRADAEPGQRACHGGSLRRAARLAAFMAMPMGRPLPRRCERRSLPASGVPWAAPAGRFEGWRRTHDRTEAGLWSRFHACVGISASGIGVCHRRAGASSNGHGRDRNAQRIHWFSTGECGPCATPTYPIGSMVLSARYNFSLVRTWRWATCSSSWHLSPTKPPCLPPRPNSVGPRQNCSKSSLFWTNKADCEAKAWHPSFAIRRRRTMQPSPEPR